MFNSVASKATIPVADDSEANRDLLCDILTEEGYKVIRAADGDQALNVIREKRLDLALLDVMMPGKTGFEVCFSIKSRPETFFIPVVLVTGLTSVSERIEGIKSGADDFLSKPVNKQELLADVTQYRSSTPRCPGHLDLTPTTRVIALSLFSILISLGSPSQKLRAQAVQADQKP